MPEFDGKTVTFKGTLSNREYWKITPIIAAVMDAQRGGMSLKALFSALDWDDVLCLLTTLIESWEFDGDPADPAAYEHLDMIRVVIPLFTEALTAAGAREQEIADLGESASEST